VFARKILTGRFLLIDHEHNRLIEEIDEMRKGIAEEAADAQHHVDTRSAQSIEGNQRDAINAAAPSAGVASYSTTSLAPGSSNVITATYLGDQNFTASSSTGSTATTIAVAPLGFTFAISGSSTATVTGGQSATYHAAIAPLYGSYPGTVSFTATGLPSGATATFSPSSITTNGGLRPSR
jgi:hypothetical protein